VFLSIREAARCGLDSAPPDAAGWRRSTPPLPSGAREFCSAAIARNAAERQGKISVERRRRKATWAKASGSRQERLQWGKAVSPNGTRAKIVRFERAATAGRNLRHEQGLGVARDFRTERSCGHSFQQAVRQGCLAGEGWLTVQLTGWAENGPCYRSRNAWARLRGGSDDRASSGALTVSGCRMWCSVAVLQVECLQGVQAV